MQLMLSAPKIWFYTAPIDFRKSINGLVGLVQTELGANPTDGIFVFHNRQRDKLKLLAWHGNGFVMLYKRLEQGKFALGAVDAGTVTLDEQTLSWLLAGLDWHQMRHWNTLSFDDYY